MADVQFRDFADGTPAGDNILLQQDTGTGVYTKFLSSLITTTLQQAFDASVAAANDPQIVNDYDVSTTNISMHTISPASHTNTGVEILVDYVVLLSQNRTAGTYANAEFHSDGTIIIASSNAWFELEGMIDAIDDTAAAAAGVPINGLYHNAGAVRIRLT